MRCIRVEYNVNDCNNIPYICLNPLVEELNELYERAYNKFVDKVKDRHKIAIDEYFKLIDEIVGQIQEVEPYELDKMILNHGWQNCYKLEGGEICAYKIKQ